MSSKESDRLIQCLIESSRCLGVCQQKEELDAVNHWEKKVEEYTQELKRYRVKMADSEIQDAIEEYLQARSNILAVGRKYPDRFGGNDNIIGRIGEFLALRFLESIGQHPSMIGHSSNPGYDLIEGNIQTQVKVITSENKKGRNVRLKKPWNQFLLIELGNQYKPESFGLLTEAQHFQAIEDNPTWSQTPIVKLTMLGPKGLLGKYGQVYRASQLSI